MKKLWNMTLTLILTVIGALGTVLVSNVGTGGLEYNRTAGDHPNYSINEIGQNTETSLGDLGRLAVTQVINHQLALA